MDQDDKNGGRDGRVGFCSAWCHTGNRKNFRRNLCSIFLRKPGALKPLDGMRALAILWVIVFHLILLIGKEARRVYLNDPTFFILRGGELGVDLFFVLSGFLVGDILLRECGANHGRINVKLFLLRRFLRIWPALFFAFFFGGYIVAASLAEDGWWWFSALVFLNNLAGPFLNGGPLWSVAVEMQLYAISPWAVMFMYSGLGEDSESKPEDETAQTSRLSRASNPWRIHLPPLVVVVSSLLIRGVLLWVYFEEAFISDSVWAKSDGGIQWENLKLFYKALYTKPYTRAGPYAIGVWAAFLHRFGRNFAGFFQSAVALLEWCCLLLSLLLPMTTGLPFPGNLSSPQFRFCLLVIGRTVYGGAVAILLVRVLCPSSDELAWHRPARWLSWFLSLNFWIPIATLSYSAYLLHLQCIFLGSRLVPFVYSDMPVGDQNGAFWRVFVGTVVGGWIITGLASVILFVLVEKPILDLRGLAAEKLLGT